MHSAKFFRLAERCAAYRGVMQARVQQEQQSGKPVGGRRPPPTSLAQRANISKQGGEAAAVPATGPSYMVDKMREARA